MAITSIPKAARFWDRIADRYSSKPVADEAAYQKKLSVTREYLRPDMEVLEFGCGTGSTALTHAPHVNHILALDVSARMIEICREKAEAAAVENVTFEQATIDEFSAPADTYDAVMALSVLHLVADRDAVIARVHAMLKPDGLFVTSTACIADSMRFFKIIAPIGRFLRLLPLLRVFTLRELETSLTGAGFEIDHQWQPGKGRGVFIVAKKV